MVELSFNFAEIKLVTNEFSVYRTEYDKKLFDECRKDPNKDFFYYRYGEHIYAFPQTPSLTKPIGFQNEIIKINENPRIFAKFLSLLFKSYFESKGRKIYYSKYSSLFYFNIQQKSPELIGDLELVPKCFFSVNPSFTNSGNIVFILTISKEFKPKFNCTLEKLEEERIDVQDFIVKEGYIQANKSNIKKYLERTGLQKSYNSKYEHVSRKEEEYNFICSTFNYLTKDLSHIDNGFNLIKTIEHLHISNSNFRQIIIGKPTLYYYNNSTTKMYLHEALKNYKPLSFNNFYDKKIKICAFIPTVEAEQCQKFINKIHSNLTQYFHIEDIELTNFLVENDRNQHLDIISKFKNKEYELALLFLKSEDKNQSKAHSDYNKLKSKLISKQIPSQNVLVENVQNSNEYTLRNFALNLYAKLGGTAWSIEKKTIANNEFIIGVGSTIDEKGNRNIGFANIFDHSGSYIVGNCTPLCEVKDYTENLKTHLSSIISNTIINDKNLSKGDKIRLIFHLFKPASEKYELFAINECIKKYIDYDIEFAIINVSYAHPFKLFKNINEQLERGRLISLTPYQALLSMGGTGRVPLQIRLDKRSTYKDLLKLSEQVLFFSHLSHRSFMPSNKPVTITYPQILAKLTNDLLSIPHWDPDMLYGMEDKLWFI